MQTVGAELLMTEEAQAVLAELVGDLMKEYLDEAKELATETLVETGVIERVVVDDVDEEVVRAIAEEVLEASLWAVNEQIAADADYVEMVVTKINDRLGRLTTKVDQIASSYVSQDQLAGNWKQLRTDCGTLRKKLMPTLIMLKCLPQRPGSPRRLTRSVDKLAADMGAVNGLIAALQGDAIGLQEAWLQR